MVDIFKIKKGDQNPPIAVTLQDSNGTAIDLSNGSVWFIMGSGTDYSTYFSGLCFITGSTTGNAEWRWEGGSDTGSVGVFFAEFETVWSGSRMTLPTDHSLKIQVFEDYN